MLAADTGDGEAGNPARAVRAEDAFDPLAVDGWLREHAHEPVRQRLAAAAGPPEVRQFAGGASNLTFLLRYPGLDLILRRPPPGAKAKSAHDMRREHDLQAALKPVFHRVPAMLGFCDDSSVIGSDFYVMERLRGTILRRDLPWSMTPAEVSALCAEALDVLVELHEVDVERAGLAGLGRGRGYVARQVAGWSDRFAGARTADTGDWSEVVGWLTDHQPPDVATCLIHNDFRFDNLVLAGLPAAVAGSDGPLRVIGVLDWEMATLGDPLMDLGGALAYWVEAGDDEFFEAFRRQPTNAPGMWSREQVVERYCERRGLVVSPEQWRFYEVFGLFRLAVIAQQIWYRYALGQTSNQMYAAFGPAVGYLESRCRRLVRD